jgi:hypothetical protein
VAGFIYAVLGVSYAVLLGLMLIAVWEQWEAADATASEEANEVAEIFWLAHRLPQPEGRHIQELARSYAQVVVEDHMLECWIKGVEDQPALREDRGLRPIREDLTSGLPAD